MRQFNYLYSYHVIYRERWGAWIQGYWFEFESKMASATKVVYMNGGMMDVVFLTLLTHKCFQQPSSSPFLPLSCFIVLIYLALYALTFAGNIYMSEFMKRVSILGQNFRACLPAGDIDLCGA